MQIKKSIQIVNNSTDNNASAAKNFFSLALIALVIPDWLMKTIEKTCQTAIDLAGLLQTPSNYKEREYAGTKKFHIQAGKYKSKAGTTGQSMSRTYSRFFTLDLIIQLSSIETGI